MSGQEVIRVIFADDDDLYMHEMSILLNSLDYITIVGKAGNGLEVMNLIENTNHDVVLLDVAMPGMSGIETVTSALTHNPDERIIMLTAFERPDMLRAALTAGAKGFLTKETEFREIGEAIKRVYRGGTPWTTSRYRWLWTISCPPILNLLTCSCNPKSMLYPSIYAKSFNS